MSTPANDNEQRLRAVGLIRGERAKLPPELAAVVDSLTPDELETLVAVKKRLDEAGRVSGVNADDVFMAP